MSVCVCVGGGCLLEWDFPHYCIKWNPNYVNQIELQIGCDLIS